MTREKRLFAIVAALLVLFLGLFASAFGTGTFAHAAENGLDDTDVMEDLRDSTIGGKAFDVNEYRANPLLSTTVLYLAESCYSYDAALRESYGLYLYVWNPQKLAWTDSGQNAVEISYGGVNETEYYKPSLKLLSVSSQAGYERLFYKFKLELDEAAKEAIFQKLRGEERVYHIVGVELVEEGSFEPRDFKVNKVYTYSGYAKGCGANREEETLSCTSTFGDVLDIGEQGGLKQTFFSPAVDDAIDGTTQETLQSVYFAVPNRYFEEEFRLGAVRMEWLKTQTAWGLVTGNQAVYHALEPWVGKTYCGYANGDALAGYVNERGGNFPTPYAFSSSLASFNYGSGGNNMAYLAYLFPTDDWSTDSADDYVLPWEDMLDYMQSYHDRYDNADKTFYDAGYEWAHLMGEEPRYGCDVDYKRPYEGEYLSVDGVTYPYSRALFLHVMDDKTVMDVKADIKYSLRSRKVDDSWWTKLWNNGKPVTKYTTRYDGIEAIHPVTEADFKGAEAATCENLLIDRNDYAEFKAFYDRAALRDETVVLVRYDVGNYIAAEAKEGLPYTALGGLLQGFEEGDTNARVFSMSAYLGLDVIHLEFDNGEEQFILPCIASPIDAGRDSTEASRTHSDRGNLVKLILALVALILLVVVLAPVLPYLVQAVVWVVAAPFKLIAAGVKAAKKQKPKG